MRLVLRAVAVLVLVALVVLGFRLVPAHLQYDCTAAVQYLSKIYVQYKALIIALCCCRSLYCHAAAGAELHMARGPMRD